MEIMTTRGGKCHTRAAPSCDIFNLGSSYFHVLLTTMRHLLIVYCRETTQTQQYNSTETIERLPEKPRRSLNRLPNFCSHSTDKDPAQLFLH